MSKPSAKRTACPTSDILFELKAVIISPIFDFETVCKWSRLTAQSFGTLSLFVRRTSVGILLIVDVIGATVISFK